MATAIRCRPPWLDAVCKQIDAQIAADRRVHYSRRWSVEEMAGRGAEPARIVEREASHE